jgi:hypothetical protein
MDIELGNSIDFPKAGHRWFWDTLQLLQLYVLLSTLKPLLYVEIQPHANYINISIVKLWSLLLADRE